MGAGPSAFAGPGTYLVGTTKDSMNAHELERILAIAKHRTTGLPCAPGTLESNRTDAFAKIYRDHLWGSASKSGPGSTVEAAAGAVIALKQAMLHTCARSLLDVGCGDFGWLGTALPSLRAEGAIGELVEVRAIDIVEEPFAGARSRFPDVKFAVLDVVTSIPPGTEHRPELVLCRQCLNHMSLADAQAALTHIMKSGATFLLASTYDEAPSNAQVDSAAVGSTAYREWSLDAPPFDTILGGPPEAKWLDEYSDARRHANPMQLALWRLAE